MAIDSLEKMAQRLEELEKRVRVTEDIDQIMQLHGRYQDAHVFGDHAGEAACFAENGVLELEGRKMTRAEILKFLDMPRPKEAIERPVLKEAGIAVHPQIRVNGDTATGHWVNYNLFSYADTKQILFWMQAFEDAEYVRENGEWKISYMKWNLVYGLPPR